MKKNKGFVINGKFLLAALEGMPRVAREVTACIDVLLQREPYNDLDVEIAVPKGYGKLANYKNIRVVETGKYEGQLWDQLSFPLYLGNKYSLNYMSTAPILKSYGCVAVHDAQFRSVKKSHGLKSMMLYETITPIVAKTYRSVVTGSEYAKKEILEYNVTTRKNIRVIPDAADHVLRRNIDVSLLEKFNLKPQEYALANSYVHHHKNVRVLFKAFVNLPLDRPLVLFGSSTLDEYKMRNIHVPDNVKFLGRVTDDELVTLMHYARMFLFPSTTEGFGLPPLEAMLLGCPTLCSNAGAIPEVCGNGAIYADPYLPEDWLNNIERLWNDPQERQKLSEAGKARAMQFSWMSTAEQYLDQILKDI